jgi:ParB family chromosome partitioning protein
MNKYISIELLQNNPDNPRRDLGDLTELTASIKQNGIYQNLTVQDNHNDTYTVLIGNRRFAASKLAGLKEVPCTIVDITPAEQASMMLTENMQRNDLTVLEQAHGMQMCLDLGSSDKDIAKETGLSIKTVKHRLEINKLDQKKLSTCKQLNLDDLTKLESIKDVSKRNDLLEYVGTNRFEWKYKDVIEEIQFHEIVDPIVEIVKEWAKPVPKNMSYWDMTRSFKFSTIDQVKKPSDSSKKTYFYRTDQYDKCVEIYSNNDDKNKASKPKISKADIARNDVKKACRIAVSLHKDFMKNLNEDIAKKFLLKTSVMLAKQIEQDTFYGWENILDDVDTKFDSTSDNDADHDISIYLSKHTELGLAKLAYSMLEATTDAPVDYNGVYEKPDMDLWNYLTLLGYKLSSDEIQLISGSYPGYLKKSEIETIGDEYDDDE